MFTQKFINIFHSVQEIGLFSRFQNLNRGNASPNPKWHLTISWATSCQYQCVCKILSKYSKRFKSYRHFSTFFTNRPASKSSQTVRWQNRMFDYRALLEIQLPNDFLRVVQFVKSSLSLKEPVNVPISSFEQSDESNRHDKYYWPNSKWNQISRMYLLKTICIKKATVPIRFPISSLWF